MTNKSTKRALLSSAIALCLCFVMLVVTTFAWFTDEVTSSGNIIKTGTLDVELYKWTAADTSVAFKDLVEAGQSTALFGAANSTTANGNSEDTLWEPGKTQTVYLSIKNNGSLDLKYTVVLEVTDITKGLNKVLSYVITPGAEYGDVTKASLPTNWESCDRVEAGINYTDAQDVVLLNGQEHFFALSVHMDELAGNEYQDSNITFNIKVLAGQLASEEDSFDNQYDALATYGDGYFVAPKDENGNTLGAFDVAYHNEAGEKVASMTVLSDALTTAGGKFTAVPTSTGNIAVVGDNYVAYEVNLEGLKANNDLEMVLQLRAQKELDESTMMVYHDGVLVDDSKWEYDSDSGLVKIQVTSFSPFVITWGNNSSSDPDDLGLPMANVVRDAQYENTTLEWESYGQWSPDYEVEKKPTLEAAFLFTAPHNADNIDDSIYADWECDFFVKLDRDLGENQIFLGGNYGSFGWVGFHNGDVTLDANTELPLLGSVTSNPWTYADVVKFVSEFKCGVGDVNNALTGATFTVTLRLTNPETHETHDAAVVTYTFGSDVSNVGYAE